MKLGVSHQHPEDLHEARFEFLRRLGVEAIEVRLRSQDASREKLEEIVEAVSGSGLELHEIMLEDLYNSTTSALNLPGRDEDIAFFKGFLKDLGELGIPHTTYAWHTGGMYETHRARTRGVATRGFSTSLADQAPLQYDRSWQADELWDNYARYVSEILPVARAAGVSLQLHPNDPPMDHQGVPRLFKSTDAVRRAMAMADQSTHSGILFCVGTWAEMRGPEGRGEDVVAALREFGRAGQVHQVHMRNITSPLPDFDETFPDGGYLDLFAIMDILVEIDFKGMIVPDHVPGDGDQIMMNEAYTLGYLRALIQYAQRCRQSRG
ncbi:MAG: mannonate dehydratase [Proteobacteria bacterium]|jgi:mannonate dehydratase|nr:mannonate dehydratase [Pseudomonadota bacterium]MDA1298621.1 mannonate dehydratase [Pseudomonadota bacterium]